MRTHATTDTAERVAEARAWLAEFFPEGDPGGVRLAMLEANAWDELRGFRLGSGPFRTATHAELLDSLAEAIVKAADDGADVYACPYRHDHGRRKGGASVRRHAHADIDGPVDLGRVRDLGALAVASGSTDDAGRPFGHVYVRLAQPVTEPEHEALCRGLGAFVGGQRADRSKVGDADVLRPAGSVNWKRADNPRRVRWLAGPGPGVRAWEPEALAGVLGVPWPILGTAAPEPEPSAGRELHDVPGVPDARAEAYTAATVAGIVRELTEAQHWPEAHRDHRGRGWERLCADAAFRLAQLALADWSPLTLSEAERAYLDAAPTGGGWRAEDVRRKWGSQLRRAHDAGPWPLPADDWAGVEIDLTDYNDKDAPTMTGAEPTDAEAATAAAAPWVDLSALLDGGALPEPPRPDFLHRADGAPLLYRARVNRLFGDPESGKTWVLLAAAAEVLAAGGRVAHLDVDHMGAAELVGRLAAFGVPGSVLGDPDRFRLYAPTDARELLRSVADVVAWAPELAGVDSLGEVLPMLGLSSNSPDDFTAAHRRAVQPLADAGACVVVIDHLAKGADSRRQGPGGTLAKGRPVRGVSLRVRRVRQYAPGTGGASALTVDKDTAGGVRAVCPAGRGAGEQPAGTFRLAVVGEDGAGLAWAIDVPVPGDLEADAVEVLDAEAMERLSQALAEAGKPMTQTALQRAAKVRRQSVGELLDALEAGGYVRRFDQGQARMTEHVRPFGEVDR